MHPSLAISNNNTLPHPFTHIRALLPYSPQTSHLFLPHPIPLPDPFSSAIFLIA
jgi:hypothetical protein